MENYAPVIFGENDFSQEQLNLTISALLVLEGKKNINLAQNGPSQSVVIEGFSVTINGLVKVLDNTKISTVSIAEESFGQAIFAACLMRSFGVLSNIQESIKAYGSMPIKTEARASC